MRFQGLRRFLGGDAAEYLKNQLSGGLDDLVTGLSKLTFRDNFIQYQTEVTIAAGVEAATEHHLGVIPSGRIIYKCVGGIIQDGATAATDKYWYLQNVSSTSSATATVIFFR